MGGKLIIRAAAAAAAAICLVAAAGCGDDDSKTADPAGGGGGTSASEPAPIPPSPVRAGDRTSEEAFAAQMVDNPCPSNLSDAVLAITQRYQQKFGKLDGDWSKITVTAAKSASATGIPQCTVTINGASPIASISLATVTAAANSKPTGTLDIGTGIKPADPASTAKPAAEPPCQITQEFLSRLQATGQPAQWTAGNPQRLADTVQVSRGDTGIVTAEWKGHVVQAQRLCADTRSVRARKGDSPDWLIDVAAADNLADYEGARGVLDNLSVHIADWVRGEPVEL